MWCLKQLGYVPLGFQYLFICYRRNIVGHLSEHEVKAMHLRIGACGVDVKRPELFDFLCGWQS